MRKYWAYILVVAALILALIVILSIVLSNCFRPKVSPFIMDCVHYPPAADTTRHNG